MQDAAVSVIIVNYNAGASLARCLAHLSRQTDRNFSVTVVDNASTDDSIECAKASPQPFMLIEAGENIGFAAANNLAARKATGKWLAFLNPDAYPADDWLAAFRVGAEKYPWADAFGSLQIMADAPEVIDGVGDVCSAFGITYRGAYGQPVSSAPGDGECFSPCAAAAFYRRETFVALGGFEERFFCYGEDVDLGFRLRLRGGRAVQLADAHVLHEGSGVTGRRSDFTVYHGARNRIWLLYKNTPPALYGLTAPVRILGEALLAAKALQTGTFPAYWRGVRDGYGGRKQFAEERRKTAAESALGARAVAGLFAWSPLAVLQRRAVLWPLHRP
ncbi:MAG: glycosyltransferase family 2 protein [Pseudomonadota bacterium]